MQEDIKVLIYNQILLLYMPFDTFQGLTSQILTLLHFKSLEICLSSLIHTRNKVIKGYNGPSRIQPQG